MILKNTERILLFILWIITIIWLILIILFRKKINIWLRRDKINKIMHFNPEDYYKLDLEGKKYYYSKIEIPYLREILNREKLEMIIIEELKKIIILDKNEFFNIGEYIEECYEPKVKCLKFQSHIEMIEIKPEEIIINI